MSITYRILHRSASGRARTGELATPHGAVATPAFIPVGTQGTVKGMTPLELRELGARIILGNTYHLFLRPGHDVIRELGGLHRFAAWPGEQPSHSSAWEDRRAWSLDSQRSHPAAAWSSSASGPPGRACRRWRASSAPSCA